MHGIWLSTEVMFEDIDGYLWGNGKKLWSQMSDEEQGDCFDWMCDEMTLENETGDIDQAIETWYNEVRDASAYERHCRRESAHKALRLRNRRITRR